VSYCILDCSAIAGWCFADEADSWAEKLLDKVVANGALVPAHWHLEVSNMMLQAEKRKRIESDDIKERLSLISRLQIIVDTATHGYAFSAIMQHAQKEKLTSYDAAYIELAIRKGLPLASKDSALKKACQHLGIKTV
jgi:predicted nucleic acid-binding protein